MTDDEWMRETLNDAVADVEPAEALDVIRARTATRPRRGWAWAAGGAGLAVAATLVTIALLNSQTATNGQLEPAQTPTATKATVPSAVAVPVYYLGDTPFGPRLYREFHRVTTDDAAVSALNEALREDPIDPDYYSVWREVGAEATSVTEADGLITIDIDTEADSLERPADLTEAQASMAIEQLLYTVQGALQSGNDVPVQVLVGGQRAPTLLGVPVGEALAAGDRLSVLSTVWIISPQEGDSIDQGGTVTGQGAFPEANVTWQLLDGSRVVDSGFTTAEECCRLAPYQFTLDSPPGTYTLRVYAADLSEGEAPGEVQDTKQITIK